MRTWMYSFALRVDGLHVKLYSRATDGPWYLAPLAE